MHEPRVYAQREHQLTDLALRRFASPLLAGEHLLIQGSVRPGPPTLSSQVSLDKTGAYTLRAGLLRWLVTDKDAAALVDPNGLFVVQTHIAEEIDLSDCRLPFNLTFDHSLLMKGLKGSTADFKGFSFVNSEMHGPMDVSLSTFTGSVSLINSGFSAPITFSGARVEGSVYFEQSKFQEVINAIDTKVKGLVSFEHATCSATPYSVHLDGAQIDGDLFLKEMRVKGALIAPHLQVGEDIHAAGMQSHSMISTTDQSMADIVLAAADIKGEVDFSSTSIEGMVSLAYSVVGAQVSFANARFESSGLDFSAASIGDDLILTGISTKGTVQMFTGRVKGDVDFTAANLKAVRFTSVSIGGGFYWRNLSHKADLDLDGSNLNIIEDDQASWPTPGGLRLAGTTYTRLQLEPRVSAKRPFLLQEGHASQRIQWLQLQSSQILHSPQSWHQLASVLEGNGDRKGAKHVLFIYNRMQAERVWTRPLSYLYDKVEEEPLRIAVPISVLWALGSVVFWRAK